MKYLPYLILAVLSAIALKALGLSPHLPLMHDQVQGERVYQMVKSISYGQFPVRYVADLGYGFGYPLFNFYAPLPYYLGSLAVLLGSPLVFATKLMITIPFIGAGVAMYLLAKSFWGKAGGLLSAILYLYAPYHAVELYVRGAVGELYTYALVPLVCIGIIALWETNPSKKRILLGGVALAALGSSHTLGLYITLLLIALYGIVTTIVLAFKKSRLVSIFIQRLLLFTVLPLLFSAYFLVPAFAEIRATNFSIATGNAVNFHDHYVTISQLWNSPWGFGGSAPGTDSDGLSFMIGKISILCSLLVLGYVIAQKHAKIPQKLHHKTIIVAFSALALTSIFLMLESSQPLWERIPYMQIVQFPWRFLIVTDLAICFVAGASVSIVRGYIPKNAFYIVTIATVFIIAAVQSKYFIVNGYYPLNQNQIKNQDHLRFEASKISDEYMPKSDVIPKSSAEVSIESVSCLSLCLVRDFRTTPNEYQFTVLMEKAAPVFIDKLNFPQFKVQVDNKQEQVLNGPHNYLGVAVPAGKHTVHFSLVDSNIRVIANSVTLLAFIGSILYAQQGKIWNLKQRRKSLKI